MMSAAASDFPKQICDRDVERPSDPSNIPERGVAQAEFNSTEIGAVYPGGFGQLFL
jgi:hypothetical protein